MSATTAAPTAPVVIPASGFMPADAPKFGRPDRLRRKPGGPVSFREVAPNGRYPEAVTELANAVSEFAGTKYGPNDIYAATTVGSELARERGAELNAEFVTGLAADADFQARSRKLRPRTLSNGRLAKIIKVWAESL